MVMGHAQSFHLLMTKHIWSVQAVSSMLNYGRLQAAKKNHLYNLASNIMETLVQLDAYSLLVLTNKAKEKFKSYCVNVKKYPLSRMLCPYQYVTKNILGFEYTTKENSPLSYHAQITMVVKGSRHYICPMFDIIVKYNEAASRSRLSKLNASFHIPFKLYKNILDIAEHGNY